MKHAILVHRSLLAVLLSASFGSNQAVAESSRAADTTKPNIILCMTDDQGWGDIGFNNPAMKTPISTTWRAPAFALSVSIPLPPCARRRALRA